MKSTNHYTPGVVDLVRDLFATEDEALRIGRRRAGDAGLPLIEVAPEDGALLGALVTLVRPRLVVEIGTLFGYSAVWIARHLPPGGRLITCEFDPNHADVARQTIEEAGVADRVDIRVGDGAEIIERIDEPVDLVFVDADKVQYPAYLRWARRALRPGGLVVFDNAFWNGKVVDPGRDAQAMAIRQTMERLSQDEGFVSAVIPTLEGMAIGVRVDEGETT